MAAREEYSQKDVDLEYIDVEATDAHLQQMLELNGGSRRVPTIIDDGRLIQGFGGT